jgi:hypothetical protein
MQSVVTVSQDLVHARLLPIGSVTSLTAKQHVMVNLEVRNDGVACLVSRSSSQAPVCRGGLLQTAVRAVFRFVHPYATLHENKVCSNGPPEAKGLGREKQVV